MKIIDADQGTALWLKSRRGLPTASMADKLVTPKTMEVSGQLSTYAHQLAADQYGGALLDHFAGNAATERGNELEPMARRAYEAHANVDVEQLGFGVSDDGRYGASLDGRVGPVSVEIKCPLASTAVDYLIAIEAGEVPPKYLPQMHLQMIVADAEACDFVVFHPHLPLGVIRVERSAEWDAALLAAIDECIAERERALAALTRLAETNFARAA